MESCPGASEQKLQPHRRNRGNCDQAQDVQHKLVSNDPGQSDQRKEHDERDAPCRGIALHARRVGIAYQRFCHSPTNPDGRTSRMAMSRIMPMPSL